MLFPDQDKVDAIVDLVQASDPTNLGDKLEQAILIRGQINDETAIAFSEIPLRTMRSLAARAEPGWPLFSAPPVPARTLGDNEILQLLGVEYALHELCYCCERIQEAADITTGSSSPTRFYLNGIYYYVTSLFLVDKSKPSHAGLPMGGTVVTALHPMGLAHLLDRVDVILKRPFGTQHNFGEAIRKLRNKHLVHGDFSPARFESLVADTKMRDPAQQRRLTSGLWDLFHEAILLDLKVVAILSVLKPNIPAIILRYLQAHP